MPKGNLSIGTSKSAPILNVEITAEPKVEKKHKHKSEKSGKAAKGEIVLISSPVKKEKIKFLEPVDIIEVVQIDQKVLLTSLKSRIAVELLNREENVYKKAGWKAVVRFAQDLENDIEKMFEKPALLAKLEPEAIHTLMTTLNTLGESMVWVEEKRRSKLKDVFSVFNRGYEAEIHAFKTSYARLNTAVRALNAVHAAKLQSQSQFLANHC